MGSRPSLLASWTSSPRWMKSTLRPSSADLKNSKGSRCRTSLECGSESVGEERGLCSGVALAKQICCARMVLPVPGAPARMTSEPGSSPPPKIRSRSAIPVCSRPMSAPIFPDQEGGGAQEVLRQEWFPDAGVRRAGQLGVAADDQDRDPRGLRIGPQALDELESVPRRHHDGRGHQVRVPGLDRLQAGDAVARLGDLVAGALEDQPHHEPDVRFVIDDQNPCYRVVTLALPFIHSESLTGSGWCLQNQATAERNNYCNC